MDKKRFIKQLGKDLKRLRNSKGLTQAQLAADCNMEISQISRIERGVLNTSIGVLFTITNALRVEITEIFKQQ